MKPDPPLPPACLNVCLRAASVAKGSDESLGDEFFHYKV